MATPKEMALRRDLLAQLSNRGYAVQMTDWPRRITWFKPNGEAMPNLPADPWHMERYLALGFTPDLPKRAEADSEPVSETVQVLERAKPAEQVLEDHSCPKCGREMRADKCAWCED